MRSPYVITPPRSSSLSPVVDARCLQSEGLCVWPLRALSIDEYCLSISACEDAALWCRKLTRSVAVLILNGPAA